VLQGKGIDMAGLFEPLSEDVGFEEVGVAAAQLVGYIEGETQHRTAPVPPVPPSPPVPPGAPAPPQPPTSGFDFSNFGFDKGAFKELDQLKGLGQMIREQLPEWIKQEVASKMAEAHKAEGASATESDASNKENRDMQSEHATRRLDENEAEQKLNFCDMNLAGARFHDTNLADSAFNDVNFAKVEFNDVNFGDVVFADCNMAGARFSDTHFEGATFSDAEFNNARFSDANFNNMSISDSNLAGARFTETSFSDASFSEVNFSNARFTEVNFGNVELNQCNVSGMKINGIPVDELLRSHRPQ
jgi:uncharacterized protein YjbI with pentapeptide repeats